jgi:hypothetical protein
LCGFLPGAWPLRLFPTDTHHIELVISLTMGATNLVTCHKHSAFRGAMVVFAGIRAETSKIGPRIGLAG